MSTLTRRLQHGERMQMTEAFAGAVTVSVPIFAPAAEIEARALRDRLKQPGMGELGKESGQQPCDAKDAGQATTA
jgi:hypothetical protein